jgi:trans-aconitate 2-methyltransferase
MNKMDGNFYNPEQMLRRTATDLLTHIQKTDVGRVLIFGGIPQDAELVSAKFPQAEVSFVDSLQTIQAKDYDLIFSNSVLQNYPSHTQLVRSLFALLNEGGILALQMPNAAAMPIQKRVEDLACERKWKPFLKETYPNYFIPAYYYEILAELSGQLDIWETSYQHICANYQQIVDLYAATEMKLFLDKLPDADSRKLFQDKVLQLLPGDYKRQSDQSIIFPFKRTFILAKK